MIIKTVKPFPFNLLYLKGKGKDLEKELKLLKEYIKEIKLIAPEEFFERILEPTKKQNEVKGHFRYLTHKDYNFLVIYNFKGSLSTLAHELLHAIIYTLEEVGQPIGHDTSELPCYMLADLIEDLTNKENEYASNIRSKNDKLKSKRRKQND